jgi:flagellar hook-associated protein 2
MINPSSFSSGSGSNAYGANPLALGGLISGLDTNSLIQKLMQLNAIPMQQLQKQQAQLQNKVNLWNQYSSLLNAFQQAADALGSASLYTGTQAASSNPSVLAVGASTATSTGVYNITVNQAAVAEVDQSNSFAGGWTLASGGTIQVNGKSVTIANNASLSDIANAINGANAGVTANIVTNSAGQSTLFIVSNTTGAAGISYVDDPSSNVLYNLGILTVQGNNTSKHVQTAGQDASITVFGQTVTGPSNTFGSTTQPSPINGVTFTIQPNATPGSTVTVTVSVNTNAIQTAIQNFVTAYNNLQSFYATNTAYNSSSKQAGALLGDGELMLDQDQVVSAMTGPVPAPANPSWNALADFGITLQSNGQLAVDNTTLTNALQTHLSDLQTLFTQPGTGLKSRLDTLIQQMTNPGTGTITGLVNTYNTEISNYAQQITNWQAMLKEEQQQLSQAFTQMEMSLAKLQRQSSALLGMLPSMTGGSLLQG